jgi:hypothetical protein
LTSKRGSSSRRDPRRKYPLEIETRFRRRLQKRARRDDVFARDDNRDLAESGRSLRATHPDVHAVTPPLTVTARAALWMVFGA